MKTKALKTLVLTFLLASIALLSVSTFKKANAMAYDRFEERFVSPVTLDSFARTTAESNGDPKVVVSGNVVMNTPSMYFEYNSTTNPCMIYASANKSNTGKKYIAIHYQATGDVKDTHFGLNCNTDKGDLGPEFKKFSELWAPEADEPGIKFDTTGNDAVLVIDINASWMLDMPLGPTYVNDFRFQFLGDNTIETTQTLKIFEIYRTDMPVSTGYTPSEGDILVDNFVRAEKIMEAPTYHWMWGDFTHIEAGFKMEYGIGQPASYTVTSEKNSNVTNAYRYLTGILKGTDGNSVYVAGVKEDGSLTNSVAFNELILRGGNKATLTEETATYDIDLLANFGTAQIKGIKIDCKGGVGSVTLSNFAFSTYDYAPYGFNGADVEIDLDLELASDYAFWDFTGTDQAGESLNWVYSRNITKNEDNSITFTVNDGYYNSSPKNGANYSNAYDYAVIEISGDDSANDNLEVCFFSDSGYGDCWVKVPNLYKAPGVSAGVITSERKLFIVDLAANQYTYMGFGRMNKNCDGIRIRTVGETNATIYSIKFCNAKAEAEFRAYTYAKEGEDARVRFSINNDKFVGVTGNDIEASDYKFAGGVLTISKDFFAELGSGTYTFQAEFEMAGTLSFTVNVEEVENVDPTPTDPTNPTQPVDPTDPQPSEKGCKNSLGVSLFATLALSSFVLVLRKKREE